MVFEGLTNPVQAEKNPPRILIVGLIYSTFAIILSMFIFMEDSSLVMIFLTSLASVPLIYGVIKYEERKDFIYTKERTLLKEHGKALSFLMFLFLGFLISFSAWYVFLPPDMSDSLFETQLRDIRRVEMAGITGNAVNPFGTFNKILFNNLKVMAFSLLFSFFYGFGAIFILSWNASVIGAAIGSFIKSATAGSLFIAVSLGLIRYLIHGIPEILAYFTAGLAGGIISIAIVRHDFGDGKFRKLFLDSLNLIGIAVALLIFAAILEVFVTPIFF